MFLPTAFLCCWPIKSPILHPAPSKNNYFSVRAKLGQLGHVKLIFRLAFPVKKSNARCAKTILFWLKKCQCAVFVFLFISVKMHLSDPLICILLCILLCFEILISNVTFTFNQMSILLPCVHITIY